MAGNIKMKIDKYNQYIKESFDPWKAVTYEIEIYILFEGFEYSTLKFKLIFSNDEDAKQKSEQSIKDRLKVFNNIVTYDIVKIEKADEQIRPMY